MTKRFLIWIQSAKRILLLTDERIDGDTTGSTLAMFHYLKFLGKEVVVFSPKLWSHEYHFLPGYEDVDFEPNVIGQAFDLAMIFDCADGAYLSQSPFSNFHYQLPNTNPQLPPLVVFDHHATNPRYGAVNQILVDASSTGEVVWRFLKPTKFYKQRDRHLFAHRHLHRHHSLYQSINQQSLHGGGGRTRIGRSAGARCGQGGLHEQVS